MRKPLSIHELYPLLSSENRAYESSCGRLFIMHLALTSTNSRKDALTVQRG